MQLRFLLLAALALVVGALIPIQAATNAAMSKALGGIGYASLVLFGISLAVLLGWIVISQVAMPSAAAFRAAPLYGWLGGFIVASYVLSITFLAPRLGVGNAICFIVTGQIFAAVLIDHFGLFGANVQPLSWVRAGGIALMIAGLFLAKLG
ncbi:MAG TPA: DMT family transporter [Rhodanobacteraceae bacterium]|nr:DMT family transporter [Rhodanobacteraceae bacterium]